MNTQTTTSLRERSTTMASLTKILHDHRTIAYAMGESACNCDRAWRKPSAHVAHIAQALTEAGYLEGGQQAGKSTAARDAFLATAMADPEGQRLAANAAAAAATWSKEWGVRWAGNNNDKQVSGQKSEAAAKELIATQAIPHMWETVSRTVGPWTAVAG